MERNNQKKTESLSPTGPVTARERVGDFVARQYSEFQTWVLHRVRHWERITPIASRRRQVIFGAVVAGLVWIGWVGLSLSKPGEPANAPALQTMATKIDTQVHSAQTNSSITLSQLSAIDSAYRQARARHQGSLKSGLSPLPDRPASRFTIPNVSN